MNCKTCGSPVLEDAEFCHKCGARQDLLGVDKTVILPPYEEKTVHKPGGARISQNCKVCGSPIMDGTDFCLNCGERAEPEEPVKLVEKTVKTEQAEQPKTAEQTETVAVNKTAADQKQKSAPVPSVANLDAAEDETVLLGDTCTEDDETVLLGGASVAETNNGDSDEEDTGDKTISVAKPEKDGKRAEETENDTTDDSEPALKKKKKKILLIGLLVLAVVLTVALLVDESNKEIEQQVSLNGVEYSYVGNGYSVVACDSGKTEVDIPAQVNDKPVVGIVDRAFYQCDSLTSITIPDSVTSIGDEAFFGCYSLTSITIPDSVTSIGDGAFSWCGGLTSITIPDSVTSIGDRAFSDCSSLTSITIPDSVTSISDHAFSYCDSLTSITIPDSVTSIGSGAFWDCAALTSITIPNSVTSIGDGAFASCDNLTNISVSDANTMFSAQNGVLFNKFKTKVIAYPCGKSEAIYKIPDSVTSIGCDAFSYCYSLTSITIPDSVTSIGADAFYGCDGLASITISDSVTSIGDRAFSYSGSLTSITYEGTKAQWKAISLESSWAYYIPATVVHCADGDIAI